MKKELIHSAPGKLVNVNGHEIHVCVYGRKRNMLPHSRLQAIVVIVDKKT
jgi:hypothetical protein